MDFYIERYKNREELIFDCEVITPMFLSGADPKTVELRPASIKGALRFWWRALNKFDSFEKMLEEEGKLFGAANEIIGKSPLKIEIEPLVIDDVNKIDCKPIYYKNKFTFKAIKANTKFRVKLNMPKGKKELYENLFLFFSIAGGLGKRVRRGFGSFIVKNKNIEIENIFKYFNLEKLNSNLFILNNNQNLQYPYLKRITIGKSFDNFEELIKHITNLAHNNDCDYTGFVKRRRINNSDREKPKRFASPLYISCYKIKEKYYPIITELNVVFDPTIADIDSNNNKTSLFVDGLVQGGR